jgi:hypothetical protein
MAAWTDREVGGIKAEVALQEAPSETREQMP